MKNEASTVIKTVHTEHDHGLRNRACRKRDDEPSDWAEAEWPMGKRCADEDEDEEEEDAVEANGIMMGGFGAVVAPGPGVEAAAAPVVVVVVVLAVPVVS